MQAPFQHESWLLPDCSHGVTRLSMLAHKLARWWAHAVHTSATVQPDAGTMMFACNSSVAHQERVKLSVLNISRLAFMVVPRHHSCACFMCKACDTGSSVPSGYSGSGFASISGLGSWPSHSIDVTRPAAGEAQRFAAQVCTTAQLKCSPTACF